MKKLEEHDILRMMKQEWKAKIDRLAESVDALLKGKVDGSEKILMSSDLKLRHKKTQFLYTVVSAGPRDVVLKTPEGKQFIVDKDELEQEYEID